MWPIDCWFNCSNQLPASQISLILALCCNLLQVTYLSTPVGNPRSLAPVTSGKGRGRPEMKNIFERKILFVLGANKSFIICISRAVFYYLSSVNYAQREMLQFVTVKCYYTSMSVDADWGKVGEDRLRMRYFSEGEIELRIKDGGKWAGKMWKC